MLAVVERHAIINSPAGAVFAFLAVPENHLRFVPGLVEFEANPPGSGWRVGSSPRAVRKMFGRELPVHYEFTEFEQDRRLGMKGNLGPITFSGGFDLKQEGTHTRVIFWLEFPLRGALVAAKPLLVQMGNSSGSKTLAGVKRLLEGSTQTN